MYDRAYKVKDGIVYDSRTADVLHHRDRWYGTRLILAVTPEGHYFEAMFAGLIMGWQIFPRSRLGAVYWALRNKAPDKVLERLGVTIFPTPDVAPDKPYEWPGSCHILGARKKLFTNDLLYTSEFLCQNPDGRFFVFDGMILLRRFVFEENVPMTQREGLAWGIRHGSSWAALEVLGYKRPATQPAPG